MASNKNNYNNQKINQRERSPRESLKLPLKPKQAIELYKPRLTEFEIQEIKTYSKIYYVGTAAKKIEGTIYPAYNHGYDDKYGVYRLVPSDHVLYRYEIIEQIGVGTFGTVVKALDHKKKEYVALKIVRRLGDGYLSQEREEIRILEHLLAVDLEDTMNVVHMRKSFHFRNHRCIVFELLGKSLYDQIVKYRHVGLYGFNLEVVREYAYSLLKCLEGLARLNIIHGDLKPANVLFREDGKRDVKVIDFGLGRYSDIVWDCTTTIQTLYYRAPEVLVGLRYGQTVDMWSLGCMLAELFTGRLLIRGQNQKDQLIAIVELLGVPPEGLLDEEVYNFCLKQNWIDNKKNVRGLPGCRDLQEELAHCDDPQFVDFIASCLEWDPKFRMTPSEALQHPWMKGKIPVPERKEGL